MPCLLSIETSLESCGVALGLDGKLLSMRVKTGENIHATQLTVMIGEVLDEAGIAPRDLNAVSISRGPGSYTGLRIGAAAAKGLCYALDIPLLALNTLEIMAKTALAAGLSEHTYSVQAGADTLLCPMIDARRMEVYYAVYDTALQELNETAAAVVAHEFLSSLLADNQVLFFGSGMAKCRSILSQHPNALFFDSIAPSVTRQLVMAFDKYGSGRFEDIVSFEPFYLKNFVPGPAGGKMLRALNVPPSGLKHTAK